MKSDCDNNIRKIKYSTLKLFYCSKTLNYFYSQIEENDSLPNVADNSIKEILRLSAQWFWFHKFHQPMLYSKIAEKYIVYYSVFRYSVPIFLMETHQYQLTSNYYNLKTTICLVNPL